MNSLHHIRCHLAECERLRKDLSDVPKTLWCTAHYEMSQGDQSSPCGTIPHEVGERITVTSPRRSYEVEDGRLGAGVLPQDLGFGCHWVCPRLLPVVAKTLSAIASVPISSGAPGSLPCSMLKSTSASSRANLYDATNSPSSSRRCSFTRTRSARQSSAASRFAPVCCLIGDHPTDAAAWVVQVAVPPRYHMNVRAVPSAPPPSRR